jgi:hypothetical protein
MPMNRSLYPENWNAIARAIKDEVGWKCEECAKQCRRNGESWVEFFADWDMQSEEFADAIEHRQRFTLTVAHLDHVPSNCDRSNLRALCAPCHLRYDVGQMGQKRRLKREREGQLRLEVDHGL